MTVPSINTSGRFVLKKPFIAKEQVRYNVTALREFSDLYVRGIDVYSKYYKPFGLVDGTVVNGKTFSFSAETKSNPVIVTLEGSDDTVLYVPSTYIDTYPIVGDVVYSRLILTADLGALPDDVPLDSILQDVEDLIQSRFGVNSVVRVARGYTDQQPTLEEHEILEQSRVGAITSAQNNFTENQELRKTAEFLDAQVKTMTQILIENNLI